MSEVRELYGKRIIAQCSPNTEWECEIMNKMPNLQHRILIEAVRMLEGIKVILEWRICNEEITFFGRNLEHIVENWDDAQHVFQNILDPI